MQRLGRWLLSGALLLGVFPFSARAQAARPRLFVSADLSKAGRVRDKLLASRPGSSPEALVATAAVRHLSALKLFDFAPGTCPEAASRICQLRLQLITEGRGWPTTELKLAVLLDVPGQASSEVAFGTVLKAYQVPASFGDVSWLQANITQLVAAWPDSVRRVFGLVPIEAKAERSGDWVTVTNATYRDLNLAPDQAVLSVGSDSGTKPDALFRVCATSRPGGPVVRAEPLVHCDALTGSPPSAPPTRRWSQVFLWHYHSGGL